MGPDPEEAVSDGMLTEIPWLPSLLVYVATCAVADAAKANVSKNAHRHDSKIHTQQGNAGEVRAQTHSYLSYPSWLTKRRKSIDCSRRPERR